MSALDNLPGQVRNSYASNRPTPVELGGQTAYSERAAADLIAPSRTPTENYRLTQALQRLREQNYPRAVHLAGVGTATTATPLVIGLGGPKLGFTWNLRRVTVGPHDYAAGSFPAGVFVILVAVGQAAPGSAYPSDTAREVISTTAMYPAEGTWGRGEVTLEGGEELRLIVTGLTTGVMVSAGGQAQETAAGQYETYAL